MVLDSGLVNGFWHDLRHCKSFCLSRFVSLLESGAKASDLSATTTAKTTEIFGREMSQPTKDFAMADPEVVINCVAIFV